VDNFVLLDHEGKARELYYHRDAAAIVFMIQVNGCLINFTERGKAHEQISYSETIAPLLQQKCVACHTRRHRLLSNAGLQHGARFCAHDLQSDPHQAHAALARGSSCRHLEG